MLASCRGSFAVLHRSHPTTAPAVSAAQDDKHARASDWPLAMTPRFD
jgi:hypothetical protein